MGMFDHVRCEYPLPGDEPNDREFQSKDMYCSLDEYTITAGGRLVLTRKFWDDDFEAAVDMQHHGIFNFYTGDGEDWWEYNAIFEKGQLVRIEKVTHALSGF